ncbi:hypothetical protein [Dethiobacter alkaliphilus]|uniref:ABC-2 type transporter n=1 Tax=Dethiobacter alkaliphilus AHT 1 TaxID=555088 RepID=C0GK67_DETAL|nr:hypothetical protein [Dethiobacter alkaliphilus]EEG76250.1 conserved hypothetical protein [Dethiobacter alkaliphilus AHT 1]
MRFSRVLLADIHYQFKYGFYFLYLYVSAVYIAILFLLPAEVQRVGAAVIIMSDPAGLGFIFIGGILLLEKGEGLHSYFSIVPATISEYIWAKVISLGLVSTLAGLVIAGIGLRGGVNYLLLTAAILVGSAVFTLFGIAVGSMARSLNNYLVIGIPAGLILMGPAFLTVIGLTHFLVEIIPATLLLRLLYVAAGLAIPYHPAIAMAGLILWLVPAYILANRRFTLYLEKTGG